MLQQPAAPFEPVVGLVEPSFEHALGIAVMTAYNEYLPGPIKLPEDARPFRGLAHGEVAQMIDGIFGLDWITAFHRAIISRFISLTEPKGRPQYLMMFA
ncbi:MAG TPA: hypothetical protein DEB40_01435 [Elusimicrobia bacterium]|nr:hypothetical protein [Elusimicrobiota bacterium]HBT60393.1 hypothetical protein [Elusimicrobiota bacterium]